MKKMVFLLTLCMYNSFYAQVTGNDDELHIVFGLKYEADDPSSQLGIHWEKESPASEVVLEGRSPLKYTVRLENDTIATLYRNEGNKLIFQDTIVHDGRPISYIEGKEIFSEFVTTDFDKDGDQDFLCWIASNVNLNKWTIIYLNDQKQKKLVKLVNNADGTDIWAYPQYNEKEKLIECELFSGVYGFQSNYTFRLEGHIAVPVYKEERDSTQVRAGTDDEGITQEFVGKNGQWELVKEK